MSDRCPKVLVTGGAGFIGSHLVDRLVVLGYRVRVVDNFSTGRLENVARWVGHPRFQLLDGDLRDPSVALEATKDVDIIFHLAADPEVSAGFENPLEIYENNVVVTRNLLEAVRRRNVKQVIFASSSTVYGEAKRIPTPEDYAPLQPISIYGASKLACEALVSGYAHTFKIKALVLRLANVVGSRSSRGVVRDFVMKLTRNPKRLQILGDGTQRKSYLHVDDCVKAMLHLSEVFGEEGELYDVYNVGNEDWISVQEVADIVTQEMGLEGVEYEFTGGVDGGRGWPGDVKMMLLDIRKAKGKGWRPTMNSRESVRRAVRELLSSGRRFARSPKGFRADAEHV